MATRAVIEIQGDSDSAVKAIDATERSLGALDAQIDDMSDTMTAASRQAAGFTSSQSQMQSAARVTTQSVQGASSALGALSSSIGQVNPVAGAAASALSSLGGGIGSLASLANPATAAVMALGVAVTAGAAIWKKHQEAVNAHSKSMEEAAQKLKDTQDRIDALNTSMSTSVNSAIAALTSLDGVSEALSNRAKERAASDAQFNLDVVEGRISALDEMVRAEERTLKALEAARDRDLSSLRDMERNYANLQAATGRTVRSREQEIARFRAGLAQQDASIEESARVLNAYRLELGDLEEEYDTIRRTLEKPPKEGEGDKGKGERDRIRDRVTDYNALADAVLKAAVASQDFARINAEIASGSGIGSALTGMLDGLDVSMLEALGLDVDTFTAAVDAAKSGLVSLKDVLDGMAADRLMEESLRAQSEWYDRMMLSAKELLELEEAEYRIAMDKLANGELLEAHERRLIELRRERNSLDGPSGDTGIQLEMAGPDTSRLDEVNDKLGQFGQSAEGMAQTAFGSLNDAIMQSIESGEKLGDVLPESFLKSIGSMASQMASLAAAEALMMTFTPGTQGNAAGLWGAAAALTAVAIGAGVAVKAVSKRGSGGGSSSSDAPSGDRTTTYIEGVESNRYHQSGIRARTYGADQANADRLHIDRGQSWA